MLTELELAELLTARFCHDLAGPIGAVNNGVEFLKEEGFAMTDQAVNLIEVSAQEAVARLQFFRNAYGNVKQPGETNLGQLKALSDGFFAHGKVLLEWTALNTDAAGVSIGHKGGKLILNMLIIVAGALIYGGNVAVRLRREQERTVIEVAGKGKGLKLQPEIQAVLQRHDNETITTRTVQAYYLMKLADSLKGEFQFKVTDETMECVITL